MKSPHFLFGFLVFSLFWPSTLGALPDPATSGMIVYADGEVTANGRVADIGDALTGPVLLKTGPNAVLEVVFGGRNVFRLGENTLARVDFSTLAKTVTVEKGLFTSVLKKLAKVSGSPAFALKTPTVNAGVRGTSFHVTVSEDRTYFCTCNGSVDLDDGVEADRTVLTNAHHGSRVYTRTESGEVTMVAGGLEDHTDASLETLARRIGVGIDWTAPDLKHE